MELQLQTLEKEAEVLERGVSPAMVPGLDLTQEVEKLEELLRKNKEELILGEQWEELFQAEMDKERGMCYSLFTSCPAPPPDLTKPKLALSSTDMHRRLHQIQSSVGGQIDRIGELRASSANLEEDIQLTVSRRRSQAAAQQPDVALRSLEQELHKRLQQAGELGVTLSGTQRELKAAEEILQV